MADLVGGPASHCMDRNRDVGRPSVRVVRCCGDGSGEATEAVNGGLNMSRGTSLLERVSTVRSAACSTGVAAVTIFWGTGCGLVGTDTRFAHSAL